MTPMPKESLFDNEEFQSLKSEEKERIRRIEKTRKLYTMVCHLICLSLSLPSTRLKFFVLNR
jgi:hypothetical protein